MIPTYEEFNMKKFHQESRLWLEAAEGEDAAMDETEPKDAGDAEGADAAADEKEDEKDPIDQIEEILDSEAFDDCSDECKKAVADVKKLLKKVKGD